MSTQDDLESFHLKKKIIPGHIDVHPTDSAIVVHYTVQASITSEYGQPVIGDRKAMQKIIRIKALHSGSNLTALAQEVVDKCKLVHPSQTREVEQVLYYLQQRQEGEGGEDAMVSNREWLRRQMVDQKKDDESNKRSLDDELEPPSVENIEQYIEGLYEEIPDKIKSTRYVIELARDHENLETLVTNDALMSALSRVLREDSRKSTSLNTNIITIFYCFSQFPQYQGAITAHKVGDMCLRIVEMEMKRFAIWVSDLKAVETRCARSTDKANIAELEQEHGKFQAMVQKQDQLLLVSFHLLLNLAQDPSIEPKMVKRGISKLLVSMMDRQTPELLILVVGFLKRLSIIRDNKDELVKMGDDLLTKLDRLIPSDHPPLQHLTLRFILNLTHDSMFRSALIRKPFLAKLVSLLDVSIATPALKSTTNLLLQLLYMLTIDDRGRVALASVEIGSLLIRLILAQSPHTSGNSPSLSAERLPLMALSINIACNPRTVAPLLADNSLKFLMKRVLKNRDPLLLKMLKGVAGCGDVYRMHFLDYIDDLMHTLFRNTNQPEIMVEILGILSSLNIPDFDFAKLAETYSLLDFIAEHLNNSIAAVAVGSQDDLLTNTAMKLLSGHNLGGSGGSVAKGGTASPAGSAFGAATPTGPMEGLSGSLAADDDITLEIVCLLGVMANDENIGPMVARTDIIPMLMELMIAKEDDDEIILQIIYCAYQFLLSDSTRTLLINKTQLVSYLIDLLYDRNVEIRKMCDVCLDLICETNGEFLSKIRHQKFHYHNSEWLQRIAQSTASASRSNLFIGESDPAAANYAEYGAAGRRGAIIGVDEFWSDEDSEDESDGDDFGRGMVVGGNSALLEGF
ncbi:kinesin-associated protein-domain-containing protein [Phlyctochytrium arcticum]|nr:kinesin-associated protein-domain-containing protein [Phlyctochytrium arcticum]